ncbi:MAG: hypothetical protein Q9172_005464 [Xanthocarpia lactea]
MASISTSSPSSKDFVCEIDAEPLHRYRQGGYHPTHLGDTFKNGRYKIMHKLGWGGYGTVWLAKDQLLPRYAAIKVMVSEISHDDHEAQVLDQLSKGSPNHPGKKHIVQLLDRFQHHGPNGTHSCLVLELLGPSVNFVAECWHGGRLPGELAWETCKQVTQALEYVHANGIAHGDLHTGNIVFVPSLKLYQTDADFMSALGTPETGDVNARYGVPLTSRIPNYLVAPASMPSIASSPRGCSLKIVDFGGACLPEERREINCSLVVRAPEAVMTSRWGVQADVWSLGCTLFELIVGCPPFANIMLNKDRLIREWVSMFGDFPEEWGTELRRSKAADDTSAEEEPDYDCVPLADWLHDTYFNDDEEVVFREVEFAEEHIELFGELLQSIMQYRPSDRPSVSELLIHPWFHLSLRFQPSLTLAKTMAQKHYVLVIHFFEFTSKPIGIRPAMAIVRVLFLDLVFIIFNSANVALAFLNVTHRDHERSPGPPAAEPGDYASRRFAWLDLDLVVSVL